MRRADREITDRDQIIAVMKKCDVCRIAVNDKESGFPYIIPLNFGLSEDDGVIRLYFHSALEGHKLDLIKEDDRACFEMDCEHELQYFEEKGNCTMAYESVIGFGRITILNDDEKMAALKKLMAHYHPEGEAYFNPDAITRTAVYCLKVESMTGKRKKKK